MVTYSTFYSEYGRRRLLTYADSFRELAGALFGDFSCEGEAQDREQRLAGHRIWENRHVLGENLLEVSRVMTRVASEVFRFRPFPEKQKKKLLHALKSERLHVADMFYIDKQEDRISFCMVMSTDRPGGCGAEQAADMLSVLMDMRLAVAVTSPVQIDASPKNFVFVEEPRFVALSGFARAIKEGENISGDNYALIETDDGYMNVLLSDGMGSGEKAQSDSEQVLDLMEKLLEAGYGPQAALNLTNSALVAAGEEMNMSTLDLCSINLYNGMCEFHKMGAAASFLKSNNFVEQISACSLPLGILQTVEEDVVSREIIDGDYIILMTDGVLDALAAGGYEEMMTRFLEELSEVNPGEIARKILSFAIQCAGGRIADDMTVVVMGIFGGNN